MAYIEMVFKSFLKEDRIKNILYILYHGNWFLGDVRGAQDITSYGLDLVLPEYNLLTT